MTRPRKPKPTIAHVFGLWLDRLNEAHRQGLVDSCHELARVAEGLKQLAEALCDRDPGWDCTIDGEWSRELFDMTWDDTMAWSTAGKIDELLFIASAYSEMRKAKRLEVKR